MNILIAEDNIDQQMLIEILMDDWGYEFDIASNGQKVVELANKNEEKYDLCLMDIDMPIMNGFEATKIMRREMKYLPIMAVTGNSIPKDKYSEVGIDDFLQKPYDPDILYDKINELTIKSFRFVFKGNELIIKKEMPMDAQHAQELKKLKDKGLVKMRLDGPDERLVIAHKNIPNKISQDFIIKKYLMTEFLNRDPERPTLCDLYRGNKNCIVETFLDNEDYIQKVNMEDDEMAKYTAKVFKEEEEKTRDIT